MTKIFKRYINEYLTKVRWRRPFYAYKENRINLQMTNRFDYIKMKLPKNQHKQN